MSDEEVIEDEMVDLGDEVDFEGDALDLADDDLADDDSDDEGSSTREIE